jgi:nicotinamide riboside transporter PnuC
LQKHVITGMVSLIVVTVFFIVTIRKGLIASLATVVIAFAIKMGAAAVARADLR